MKSRQIYKIAKSEEEERRGGGGGRKRKRDTFEKTRKMSPESLEMLPYVYASIYTRFDVETLYMISANVPIGPSKLTGPADETMHFLALYAVFSEAIGRVHFLRQLMATSHTCVCRWVRYDCIRFTRRCPRLVGRDIFST